MRLDASVNLSRIHVAVVTGQANGVAHWQESVAIFHRCATIAASLADRLKNIDFHSDVRIPEKLAQLRIFADKPTAFPPESTCSAAARRSYTYNHVHGRYPG
jgi:hypothetical protein